MAVDKLVDSTQLDADLTSVANAIRTKGGTSAQMAFPAGFVSAIDAIPQGGGTADRFSDARQLNRTFANVDNTIGNNIPTTPLELTLPRCQAVERAFVNARTFEGSSADIILHFSDESPTVKLLSYAFAYSSLLNVKITGDLSGVTNYQGIITGAGNITRLDAELDFTHCTSVAYCNIGDGGRTTLTYLRYKPNTLSYSHDRSSQQVLDEDSLVSIANGLNESATGQTLTLYSTRKALCDTIMGSVGMDATNTFHVFTKDSGGSVTLTDFITNTKGWTLA